MARRVLVVPENWLSDTVPGWVVWVPAGSSCPARTSQLCGVAWHPAPLHKISNKYFASRLSNLPQPSLLSSFPSSAQNWCITDYSLTSQWFNLTKRHASEFCRNVYLLTLRLSKTKFSTYLSLFPLNNFKINVAVSLIYPDETHYYLSLWTLKHITYNLPTTD